ncbi:hypothetical protein LZT09_13000 [Vibrio fluvialis]|jgi:hypothetical protein|uniref:hypothetical protein n=1 Tax=Vibrio fluvialis TaxID=676 RepID=UPI001C9CF64C|nr:hypothetical protein [Vibrio fluvialis]ELE5025521.1 hypothetical protein [Vibrio fluvialis]ELK3677461.1 hypothetical protein [Vibrio fluvialis]MBY8036405.1 hypothetical protein [Vibrio fluvialis]MBY8209999.1 hypothetical protein [Vibrio fluvialis]MBY8289887.1 hypothetical protein [Vibrio fluvialis]
MSKCVIDYNGYVMTSSTACDYVVLTSDEANNLLNNPSSDSLNIDPALYSTVSGYLLLSLIGGHILGRIVKALGRG